MPKHITEEHLDEWVVLALGSIERQYEDFARNADDFISLLDTLGNLKSLIELLHNERHGREAIDVLRSRYSQPV